MRGLQPGEGNLADRAGLDQPSGVGPLRAQHVGWRAERDERTAIGQVAYLRCLREAGGQGLLSNQVLSGREDLQVCFGVHLDRCQVEDCVDAGVRQQLVERVEDGRDLPVPGDGLGPGASPARDRRDLDPVAHAGQAGQEACLDRRDHARADDAEPELACSAPLVRCACHPELPSAVLSPPEAGSGSVYSQHRTHWPGASGIAGGSVVAQRAMADGQLLLNRHPAQLGADGLGPAAR